MTSPRDRDLLEALTRLNTAIATFSMNLFARKPDSHAHVELALMLLDGADRVLRRVTEGRQNEHGKGDT